MPKRKAASEVSSEVPKRLKPSSETRQAKKVQRYTEVATEAKKVEEIVVPKGKGTKLGSIENVAKIIKSRTKSDDLLRHIHTIVLGRPNKKTDVKGNLLAFNGVVYANDQGRKKLEDKLEKLSKTAIKPVFAFFGIDPKAETKEARMKKLLDYLEKPVDFEDTFELGDEKVLKAKKPKKSSSSAPKPPKRAKSAYMFYFNDVRDELAKQHPKEGVTDIAKRIGAAWKALSEEEKKPYESQAAKDKARYKKESLAYKRTTGDD